MLEWLGSLPFSVSWDPSIWEPCREEAGGQGLHASCLPDILGSSETPTHAPTSLQSQILFSGSWRELNGLSGKSDCLKGLFCKELGEGMGVRAETQSFTLSSCLGLGRAWASSSLQEQTQEDRFRTALCRHWKWHSTST